MTNDLMTKLYDKEVEWKAEDPWEGMPEFIQEKKEEHRKIIVRFKTQEDLEEFEKLIDQKMTDKTKSIWHPKLVPNDLLNTVFVDNGLNGEDIEE